MEDLQASATAGQLTSEQAAKVFAAASFLDIGLAPALVEHMEGHLGFTAPTHIQKMAIPAILSGRDTLVKADTGTGKTIVYLAPVVHALLGRECKISRSEGTFALVLAPTRELCLQIEAVAQQLVHRFHWLVPGHVMGGEKLAKEKARFRKGITILVATPGRLLDHLKNTAAVRLDHLQWLIFDEADRLLDLGFEKDIVEICDTLKFKRHAKRSTDASASAAGTVHSSGLQTVLLSATLNNRVDKLATLSLKDHITVGLDEPDRREEIQAAPSASGSKAPGSLVVDEAVGECARPEEDMLEYRIPSQLQQHFIRVPCRLRLISLATFLRWKGSSSSKAKLVVFFSTCDAVEFHHSTFSSFTITLAGDEDKRRLYVPSPLFKLHGSLSQKERAETFFAFSKAANGILLCTDVAARGLDFPAVTGILQYDPPGEAADHVHRVGRTARLGQKGEAHLFLMPSEVEYLDELACHQVNLHEMPLMEILNHVPLGKQKRLGHSQLPENHFGAQLLQMRLEPFVESQKTIKVQAVDSFRSFVRAYAAHRGSLKRIFHPKKLHLGHVAKSFGLGAAPSLLGQSSTKKELKRSRDERILNIKRKKRRIKPALMSD
eukprot:SM000214S06780  [mRNA]  locus=s214:235540:239139:+ [translate_table: standard]